MITLTATNCERRDWEQGSVRRMVIELDWLKKERK
jgi:hypothetical protein